MEGQKFIELLCNHKKLGKYSIFVRREDILRVNSTEKSVRVELKSLERFLFGMEIPERIYVENDINELMAQLNAENQ